MVRHVLAAAAVILAPTLAAAGSAVAEDDARPLMERVDSKNRAKDERALVSVLVLSARGERRTRELETLFKAGEGRADKLLVRFLAPADVKGTGLLTLEQDDGDDEQYLFVPELRKSTRIAGATRAQSFAGTDFTHGDLRTEDLKKHRYRLEGEATEAGRACHVIAAVPKDDAVTRETGYEKRTLYVDKDEDRLVVLRVDYYDAGGKLLKVQTNAKIERVGGYWRPGETVMENKQTGSKTTLVYDRGRELDQGIADGKFTKRELEKP